MPSLLIIEDEPKLRRSLQRGLQEAGYVVCTAGTAGEARRFMAEELPDAVWTYCEYCVATATRGLC
jgi:DNA-binding response OmpR family regulator